MTDKPMSENEEIAIRLVSQFCDYTSGRGYCHTHMGESDLCRGDVVLVQEALSAKDLKHQEEVAALRAEVEKWKKTANDEHTCSLEDTQARQEAEAEVERLRQLCTDQLDKQEKILYETEALAEKRFATYEKENASLRKQLEEARGLVEKCVELLNHINNGLSFIRDGINKDHVDRLKQQVAEALKLIKEWRERA